MTTEATLSVEMLAVTPRAEQTIELAGRTAYKSFDRITDTSAGEFTVAALLRDGIPRRQIVEEASLIYGIPEECVEEVVAAVPA